MIFARFRPIPLPNAHPKRVLTCLVGTCSYDNVTGMNKAVNERRRDLKPPLRLQFDLSAEVRFIHADLPRLASNRLHSIHASISIHHIVNMTVV